MIKLNYAHICDYAFLSANRTPTLIGIFSEINGKSLPAVHPLMVVVADFTRDTNVTHRFVVTIKTPSGKLAIPPIDGTAEAPDPIKKNVGVIVYVYGLKLEEQGTYTIEMTVNNDSLGIIASFDFGIK